MKRIFPLVIAFLLCFVALGESKTIGISTVEFLSAFESYMAPFGIATYPMEITDREKDKDSFTKLFTKYCSIYVSQKNGMVQSFKVVSKEDDGSEQRTNEIMASFLGAIMLTNLNISADDAINALTQMIQTHEVMTIDGLNYRFVTGQPFTTIMSIEVTPEE